MTQAVFDKATELRNIADGAETATAAETAISYPVRFLPGCSWVIYVSALDAAGADETYLFELQVSDLVGGTFSTIATFNWPRAKGAGKVHIPISGDLASFQDTDSDWICVKCTQAGVSSSIVYGSYLTKAANKLGIAAEPGDIVVSP